MDLLKKLYAPLQAIVLFLTLALSLAYLVSNDYVIRPPAGRGRQNPVLAQQETVNAKSQESASSKSQAGRLTSSELARIANAS